MYIFVVDIIVFNTFYYIKKKQIMDSIEEVVSHVSEEEIVVDIQSPPRCRICLDEGELINLGCACKGELTFAHQECAKKWFTVKNTK